jgi:hypothetical protein
MTNDALTGEPLSKTLLSYQVKGWLSILFFIALIAGCSALVANNDPTKDPANIQYNAQQTCEGWVKDKLKAPATADFGGAAEVVTDDPSDPALEPAFTITGVVDAQNGFGANVRSTWTCSIHTSGTQWIGSTEVVGS